MSQPAVIQPIEQFVKELKIIQEYFVLLLILPQLAPIGFVLH